MMGVQGGATNHGHGVSGGTLIPPDTLGEYVTDNDPLMSSQKSGVQPGAWTISLLNAIGEGVCLVTPTGALVWANDLVRSWGPKFLERVSEVGRQAHTRKTVASGVAPPVLVQCEGREFELATARVLVAGLDQPGGSAPAGSPPGVQVYMSVVAREVTTTVNFRRKIDAIDRAGSELMRLDAESIRRLNSHERLKFLEQKIVRYARDLLHFDHFAIRLLDERTGKLELVMGFGLPPEFDLFDIFARPTGSGISGFVAATGKSYVCNDVTSDELFLPGIAGAQSSLTVPLRLQDRVIGIINVESNQARSFGDEELQLAEIFARYVAMAVHMLDLLVVERSTTNQTVSGRVQGELDEPLKDIMLVVDLLARSAKGDPAAVSAVERIRRDVESIRQRVSDCAQGPTTLLGVEKALADKTVDPLFEHKKVLVADDEPRIRQIISEVLRHRGCDVTVVDNGAAAIAEIDTLVAAGGRFDLVVSDIRMPDRNGYEVFSSIKRVMTSTPVILMTGFGYDPHHSIVRASQEGLQAVLFKPFEVERLLDEVRKGFLAASK
jgi:two-component system, sensor histidine kinase SagS